MTNNRDAELDAIAHDLNLCDIGLVITKGKLRKRYEKQRKACLDRLAEMNKEDGLDSMSIDDIMKELDGEFFSK